MSSSKGAPDAWDDDWAGEIPDSEHERSNTDGPKKLSKTERRRKQLELNKRLWEEAESPGVPYLVERNNDIPLQSGFTPNVKVLSRKSPAVKAPFGKTASGIAESDIRDSEDEELPKLQQISQEERAERARRELEEKQRKYDEVRQKIFGSAVRSEQDKTVSLANPRPRNPTYGGSSGAVRPRGSSRGGSSGRGSPSRQLYDPNGTRASSTPNIGRNTLIETVPVRSPRGPDGSGRGGRGFVHRGGRGAG